MHLAWNPAVSNQTGALLYDGAFSLFARFWENHSQHCQCLYSSTLSNKSREQLVPIGLTCLGKSLTIVQTYRYWICSLWLKNIVSIPHTYLHSTLTIAQTLWSIDWFVLFWKGEIGSGPRSSSPLIDVEAVSDDECDVPNSTVGQCTKSKWSLMFVVYRCCYFTVVLQTNCSFFAVFSTT